MESGQHNIIIYSIADGEHMKNPDGRPDCFNAQQADAGYLQALSQLKEAIGSRNNATL